VRRLPIPFILLTHPFELCISLILMLAGIQSFIRGQPFSAAIERDLTWALTLAWTVGIFVGALMVFVALLLRRQSMSEVKRITLRGIERSGLYFLAGSSWVYAFVIGTRGTASGYAIGMMTAVGVACVFRCIALRRADRATVEAYHNQAASDAQ
jgi:hypothetical protein